MWPKVSGAQNYHGTTPNPHKGMQKALNHKNLGRISSNFIAKTLAMGKFHLEAFEELLDNDIQIAWNWGEIEICWRVETELAIRQMLKSENQKKLWK